MLPLIGVLPIDVPIPGTEKLSVEPVHPSWVSWRKVPRRVRLGFWYMIFSRFRMGSGIGAVTEALFVPLYSKRRAIPPGIRRSSSRGQPNMRLEPVVRKNRERRRGHEMGCTSRKSAP